jgi:hypothetical protein
LSFWQVRFGKKSRGFLGIWRELYMAETTLRRILAIADKKVSRAAFVAFG